MGGAASLDTHSVDRRKFAVCAAADLYGRKSNVRLVFPCRPGIPQLLDAATHHFLFEANALRPPGAPAPPFHIEQLHVYDSQHRRWVDLVDPAQLRPGVQVFAFQPRAATAMGASFDHPSVIPEAVGEAVVASLAPAPRLDYSLEHKLRAVFLAADRGDKGYLLQGDLHDSLTRSGVGWDYYLAREYFAMVNTSGNGRLTYTQWARFGRDHPEIVDLLFFRPRNLPANDPAAPPPVGVAPVPVAPMSVPGLHAGVAEATWQALSAGKPFISYEDLRAAFLRAGQPWDMHTVGTWFAEADANASGHVDWAEWWRFAQLHPGVVEALSRGNIAAPPPGAGAMPIMPAAPPPGYSGGLGYGPIASTPPGHPAAEAAITRTWQQLTQGKPFISYADMRAAMLRAGLPWDLHTVGQWFAEADRNASGTIDWAEWWRFAQLHPDMVDALGRPALAGAAPPLGPALGPTLGPALGPPLGPAHEADTATVWHTLSAGKGFITYHDLRAAFLRAGLAWDAATAGQWFAAADADLSGHVVWEEWWTFSQRHPAIVDALRRCDPAAPFGAAAPPAAAHFPPPGVGVPDAHPARHAAAAAYAATLPPHLHAIAMEVWRTLSAPSGMQHATFQDLRAAFLRAQQPWDAANVWFAAADADGSGHITVDEWLLFAQRSPHVIEALAHGNAPAHLSSYPGPHVDPLSNPTLPQDPRFAASAHHSAAAASARAAAAAAAYGGSLRSPRGAPIVSSLRRGGTYPLTPAERAQHDARSAYHTAYAADPYASRQW